MTINTDTILKPTIHLNGTGRRALSTQYENASEALRHAIEVIAEMGPNGRDYYPQGDDAFYKARDQFCAQLAKVNEVKEYVDALLEHVVNSGGKR